MADVSRRRALLAFVSLPFAGVSAVAAAPVEPAGLVFLSSEVQPLVLTALDVQYAQWYATKEFWVSEPQRG